jgi:hypothetical protein
MQSARPKEPYDPYEPRGTLVQAGSMRAYTFIDLLFDTAPLRYSGRIPSVTTDATETT